MMIKRICGWPIFRQTHIVSIWRLIYWRWKRIRQIQVVWFLLRRQWIERVRPWFKLVETSHPTDNITGKSNIWIAQNSKPWFRLNQPSSTGTKPFLLASPFYWSLSKGSEVLPSSPLALQQKRRPPGLQLSTIQVSQMWLAANNLWAPQIVNTLGRCSPSYCCRCRCRCRLSLSSSSLLS